MTFSPLDLVSAHSWERVAFTTYALSLSFFEAAILDRLTRGGGANALILTDVNGVRGALGEKGATRAGKDYEIEPVAVASGAYAFHPKISVFSSATESHLLVGSGNLTFGGWGGNLEVAEHLHPSFAANAIEDAADFFEHLATTDRAQHLAMESCVEVADRLRRSTQGQPQNPGIRLIHNVSASIGERLAEFAEELGGATRLIVVSPFWDSGEGIDQLCRLLRLEAFFAHVHDGGTVLGLAGANWPTQPRFKIHPALVDEFSEETPRRLHAKLFEIICRRGRVLVSGSANATAAALGARRNIEACTIRLERETKKGWTLRLAQPPTLHSMVQEKEREASKTVGALRADLQAHALTGRVLTPRMIGPVRISRMTSLGPVFLGETRLSEQGDFQIDAPELEIASWKGAQLVVRVEDSQGNCADGFVSVATFADVSRRAGSLARKLFALLAGSETPSDVAAIVSWLNEDPSRLSGLAPHGTSAIGHDGAQASPEDVSIDVSKLRQVTHLPQQNRRHTEHRSSRAWQRFMHSIFAALREKRGPLIESGILTDKEDREADTRGALDNDPAVRRSLQTFRKLFDRLLESKYPQHRTFAFDLTQYLCERLQPDPPITKSWLERLVYSTVPELHLAERREDFAAGILTLQGFDSSEESDRVARTRLLQLGWNVDGTAPRQDLAAGFQSVLSQRAVWNELWSRVQNIRTYHEQARAYLRALTSGKPAAQGYEDLFRAAPEEGEILGRAIESEDTRDRLLIVDDHTDACPRCNLILPTIESSKLLTSAVATAKNCCQRVIVWVGPN